MSSDNNFFSLTESVMKLISKLSLDYSHREYVKNIVLIMIQFRHLFIYNHQKYVSYSKKKSFCSKYCHALVGQVNKSHWKVAPVIWKQCDTHILKQNQFKVLPINQQLNSLTFDTNTKSHIHQWQRHGFSDELSLVIKSNVTVLEKIKYLSWDFHIEPFMTLHDLTMPNQNKWQLSQDPTSFLLWH